MPSYFPVGYPHFHINRGPGSRDNVKVPPSSFVCELIKFTRLTWLAAELILIMHYVLCETLQYFKSKLFDLFDPVVHLTCKVVFSEVL